MSKDVKLEQNDEGIAIVSEVKYALSPAMQSTAEGHVSTSESEFHNAPSAHIMGSDENAHERQQQIGYPEPTVRNYTNFFGLIHHVNYILSSSRLGILVKNLYCSRP